VKAGRQGHGQASYSTVANMEDMYEGVKIFVVGVTILAGSFSGVVGLKHEETLFLDLLLISPDAHSHMHRLSSAVVCLRTFCCALVNLALTDAE